MINQEEIKSQDDVVVNQGGRSSDVLVATIEKCEKLEKQLKIAVNRFLVIKNQIELWKTGYYGKKENCVEYYIEKTVDEALAKIKEKD